jgi:rhamnose transport system ATP-binding protein
MTIELAGISRSFGAVRAVAGVSCTLNPGEIVALAGENGSGKSTLMKILAGVVSPDEGTITIDGEPHRWHRPADAQRAGIALVAQEPTLLPDLPVHENVMLPLLRQRLARPVRRKELARRAAEQLERLGVDGIDPLAPMAGLSVAEQSFVEIAKALVTEPRLLVLDEATSRLGPDDVEALFATLRRQVDHGLGVVLITHRIEEMTSTADRAVVLRDGHLVGELPRAGLTEAALVRLMVGRDIAPQTPDQSAIAAGGGLDVEDVLVGGAPEPVLLSVRPGEIVGLAGLVGAGRTELLEALAGARPRAEGAVTVDGVQVAAGSVAAARRAGIGLVPEDRHRQGLVLAASVDENYGMGRHRWHGSARRRSGRAGATAAVEQFGIKAGGVDNPVSSLSGGNQQKVVVARALAAAPRVLLLDEPSRGVDIGAREDIYRIIAEEAARGVAVLVASSEIAELLAVCHRVLVMHQRRIVGELAGEDLTEDRIGHLCAGGKAVAHVA